MSISAHDLPQPRQKPAFEDLLEALNKLHVDPPVWNLKISRAEIQHEQDTTVNHRREIAGYLSNIIKSDLLWIEDEDQREELWNEASRRLSERCGRAGECLNTVCLTVLTLEQRWERSLAGGRFMGKAISHSTSSSGSHL